MGLTIGKLAQKAQVNVETIRYYQRVGLLKEPEKPAYGYRYYPYLDTAFIIAPVPKKGTFSPPEKTRTINSEREGFQLVRNSYPDFAFWRQSVERWWRYDGLFQQGFFDDLSY